MPPLCPRPEGPFQFILTFVDSVGPLAQALSRGWISGEKSGLYPKDTGWDAGPWYIDQLPPLPRPMRSPTGSGEVTGDRRGGCGTAAEDMPKI